MRRSIQLSYSTVNCYMLLCFMPHSKWTIVFTNNGFSLHERTDFIWQIVRHGIYISVHTHILQSIRNSHLHAVHRTTFVDRNKILPFAFWWCPWDQSCTVLTHSLCLDKCKIYEIHTYYEYMKWLRWLFCEVTNSPSRVITWAKMKLLPFRCSYSTIDWGSR